MQQVSTQEAAAHRVPEARYSYYRRCQIFRKNGEQCKAPAEKDAHICYAHVQQQATALRRKLELAVLLAEVARRMRARGRTEFEVTDIFVDSDAIQITLAVMAQALIDGRIDCKVAGRLMIGLQTAMKLLRVSGRVRNDGDESRDMKADQSPPKFVTSEARFSEVRSPESHFSEPLEEDKVHGMDTQRSVKMAVIISDGLPWNSAHALPEFTRAA